MKVKTNPTRSQKTDIILTLCAMFAMPIYYYGTRVLVMLACAILTSFIADLVCQKFLDLHGKFKYDITSLITAMICTLLLSAAVPYWVVVVAVSVALVVAKYPFGGAYKNIFNPAAVGLAFVGLCWPSRVFSYPLPFWWNKHSGGIDSVLVSSPEHTLSVGGIPKIESIDALLGKFAGPMGATMAIIIAACALYLVVRKTISFHVPVATILTTLSFLIFFPRIDASFMSIIKLETISGVVLFGAVFMASDPSTCAVTKPGKIWFGFILGFLTIIFKYFSNNEYDFIYALLITNALSGSCDHLGKRTIILYNRLKSKLKTEQVKITRGAIDNEE